MIKSAILALVVGLGIASAPEASTITIYNIDLTLTEAMFSDNANPTVRYNEWAPWGLKLNQSSKGKVILQEHENGEVELAVRHSGRVVYHGRVLRAANGGYESSNFGDIYGIWSYAEFSLSGGKISYTEELEYPWVTGADATISHVVLAPIPVPAGAALLPVAIAGLGLMRRRRALIR